MPFDIKIWKEQLNKKMPGWRDRMQAVGVNSAYYFIAAISLSPVLQSAQSGDWSSLVSLGTILGGAGCTNLLADLVQKLRDKSDVEVAEILEAGVKIAPELKIEIDVLLQNLDAFYEAELVLSSEDKHWFSNTIEQEFSQLKNSNKYTATLMGDGAIAEGNEAISLGKNAILIQGNVSGNFIQTRVINVPKNDPEVGKRQKALETYLNRLQRVCLSLPLVAIGGDESADSDVTLDKVYVELNTTEIIKARLRETGDEYIGSKLANEIHLSALEAASQSPRLILLGDPGAGKSTFVKKALVSQALAHQGLASQPEGFDTKLIPVLVNLRDLTSRLAVLDVEKLPIQKRDELLAWTVWEQIRDDLGDECADFSSELQDAVQAGQCLLALDGLDEVPQDLRRLARQTVDAFINRFDVKRVIMTCRLRSYVGEAVFPQFTRRILAPFTVEQIDTFVQGWYNTQRDLGHISETQAKERIADLYNAVNRNDLRELSSNPMLLTTMAMIHNREVGLPRERVRLYHLAVDVLLRRWQKHKIGDAALAEFLKNDLKLRSVIENLAYAAHIVSTESNGVGALLRKDAIDLLEKSENFGDLKLAGEFLDYVDQRAGILVGYGGELSRPLAYSFPHRTFQEYLAGAYLAGQRDRVRIFISLAAKGDSWNLAAQLAFEELFYNRRATNELLDLAYQLGASSHPGDFQERISLWAGQIMAIVGLEAIKRDSHPSGGQNFIDKFLMRLVKIIDGCLEPFERAEAGRVLAQLGDPRSEILNCERLVFCHIPASSFLYGNEKKKIDIPYDYWMGKYPITNAQYQQFVAAGGYSESRYWRESIKKDYWKAGKFKGNFDREFRVEPVAYGDSYSLPNHPVVGITWYEAQAFTHWLSEQIYIFGAEWIVDNHESEVAFKESVANKQLTILLPSEKLWEKAARGTDGRTYPWGGSSDENRANYDQTGINCTNAVGIFPEGKGPYGTLEMSGNVWEWTSTLEGTARVLRGGSFEVAAWLASCTSHERSIPSIWNRGRGFRVMAISLENLSAF